MHCSFCDRPLQLRVAVLLRDPQICLLGRLVLDHHTHPNSTNTLQSHPSPNRAATPLDPARRALRRLEQRIEAAAQLV